MIKETRAYLDPWAKRLATLPQKNYDVVIVGAGIAGMTTALSLASSLNVALISRGLFTEISTYKAQGGMAVAVGPDDSVQEHAADTIRVGKGLCNEDAVKVLVNDGPGALTFLQSCGANFAHSESGLILTREAGHSRNRVVHYYDYTGRHIVETLAGAISSRTNIDHLDQAFLVDILTTQSGCCGCIIERGSGCVFLKAPIVVIATGGYSGLFRRSTNAVSSNGGGIAAAYRAGAIIADMEFVQFHPTTTTMPDGQVFLLTEALRGEGATLLNSLGERFMFKYHPDGELAPRDEVARAILHEAAQRNNGTIYLDARRLGKGYLMDRFRQVYSELAKNNYFMEQNLIPISPAAHYTIGGIKTNLWGQTNIPLMYACGEAAATGVHGANRLASNSLLEGAVFGRRVASHINQTSCRPKEERISLYPGAIDKVITEIDLNTLRTKLDQCAGLVRNGYDLEIMLNWLGAAEKNIRTSSLTIEACHIYNSCQLAKLLLEAALLRTESRGCHYRLDYPENNDAEFKKHIYQQWGRKAVIE